ncbi:hypothetical protein B4U84_29160 [Westiellopsis prolifica IICB1]|nr:hypothetical protein B4U84_29160 [Westiellopsis prolifica IICB1]
MANNDFAQPSHLDRLLSDKPPEFQAKVLRFAVDSGMRPEDPAFRLVQYIGYLAQLTETAPHEWKQLFKKLQFELSEWTELTAQQLKDAGDQSEKINNLAQSCNRLTTALNALDLTSQQQLIQLQALSEVSPSYKSFVSEIPTFKKLLVNLNQALSQNQTLKVELNQAQMSELKREILAVSGSRELNQIRGEIEDLARNQRWLMQKIEQLVNKEDSTVSLESKIASFWSRLLNSISLSICSLFLNSRFVVTMVCFLVGCVLILMISKVGFQLAHSELGNFTQQQIERIHKQVEYTNVKLQRIEKKLGTDPRQK